MKSQKKLTPAAISDGMNAAARNAKDLVEDAKVLLDNGRYSRALALAILSIEESGKISVLRGLATATSESELKEQWKKFRSHRAKNVQWILVDLGLKGARKLEDLKPIFDEDSDHPEVLDQLKQASLYTDYSENGKWMEPNSVVDENLAKSIVKVAGILCDKKQHTPQEIELWIKHMAPVSDQPLAIQKTALRAWFREMETVGLFREGAISLNEFLGESNEL